MNEYKCNRCGKFFKQKICLIKHLKKQSPCPPNISDISRKDFLETVLDPFYYKKYIKPKQSKVSVDINDRLYLVEEQLKQIQKRYYLHPLEINGIQNLEDIVRSESFKKLLYLGNTDQADYLSVVAFFKKSFNNCKENSCFFIPDSDSNFVCVLKDGKIFEWTPTYFASFVKRNIIYKIKNKSFIKWKEEHYLEGNNTDEIWDKRIWKDLRSYLASSGRNRFKRRYYKPLQEEN
jgi:hypothetical protein